MIDQLDDVAGESLERQRHRRAGDLGRAVRLRLRDGVEERPHVGRALGPGVVAARRPPPRMPVEQGRERPLAHARGDRGELRAAIAAVTMRSYTFRRTSLCSPGSVKGPVMVSPLFETNDPAPTFETAPST